MRRTACCALILLFLGVLHLQARGQVSPNAANQELRRQLEIQARNEADFERRLRDMRQLENKMIAMSKRDEMALSTEPVLTKDARERVVRLRKVDPADLARYSLFLKQDGTGIFRLFPDHDCSERKYIRIDGPCEDFVPLSSSFSFRTGGYTDRFYQDIGFSGDDLVSGAFFAQGTLVSLGDLPIEQVSLAHPALTRLARHAPATDVAGARAIASELANGIDFGEYRYSAKFKAAENTTYVVRSTAFKLGSSLPPLTQRTSMTEMRFHSLAHDKRADIVVAFRIIRRDSDGVTIVWRQLDRKEAPKLKFGKGEPLADFNPEQKSGNGTIK